MNISKKLSVSQAYTRGWSVFRQRPLFFVSVMLLIFAVGAVGGSLLDIAVPSATRGSVSLLALVVLFSALFVVLVSELFKFGLKKICLRLVRDSSVSYEHLVSSYTRGTRYVVCLLIFNLIVLGVPLLVLSAGLSLTATDLVSIAGTTAGAVALAVVIGLGGFLALVLHLYPYVLLDNPGSIRQIFNDAWTLTDNARFDLVIFYAVAALLNFVGALVFGVGLLITIPLTIIAQADVYQQLRKHTFSFDTTDD
jgi:hypothetical protein